MKIIDLDPKKCVRWDLANRASFEFGNIEELARDIKLNGQVEPILARPSKTKDFDFDIIAGARRWKACLESNLPLKSIVKNLTDTAALHHQLKENDQVPISDYSKGIHFSKAISTKKASVSELCRMMQCSRRKITHLLTFAKIQSVIWDAVGNMSKVSSRAAGTIFRLSNKGQEYIEALIDVAEEIRKGAGSRKIEALVLTIVLGESPELEYQKKIVTPQGNTIGFWTKNGITFEKGLEVNQAKIEAAVIQALM